LIDRTLAHYRITATIGAGGMGEVHRATDTKLGRDVALKVLPAEMASDPKRLDRFQREAKALAALNHPHIVTIYSVEEAEGIHFLTMELVEGEPLDRLIPEGGLSVERTLEVATASADALAAAHEKGIVHRDLKPGNIMLTDSGRVKVLDFGLAKMSGPGEALDSNVSTQARTDEGVAVGTLGYMSPEQVRGLVVDHRSDVFSFGTILYELLTGKRAFKRDTVADTISAILNEEPPDLSLTNRSISPGLERLVHRCLEKKPERRFQSAHDIAVALDELSSPVGSLPPQPRPTVRWPRFWLAAGAVALVATAALSFLVWRGRSGHGPVKPARTAQGGKPTRIVVLPFENLGAPQDAYFAAGMTEEIMSRLGNLQGLAVISRTTAIGYDRKGKTVSQIGADLGVDFVLEGTVRWDRGAVGEGRVRIAPQLIVVADDTPVWGERYDRVMADALTIQSEVAENVVRAMGVKLAPREQTALTTSATKDPEAYDLYLRGLEMVKRGQARQNLEEAVRLFRAATDRDPRFAQALAQLAQQELYIYFLHLDRNREHVDRAKQVVDQLATLGPDLAETHIARAWYFYYGLLQYPRALEEFKVARALQPSNTEVLSGIAFILRRQGRWEEAIEQIDKWLEIDPRSPNALSQYGQTSMCLRRYAAADRVFALSASLNPQFGNPWDGEDGLRPYGGAISIGLIPSFPRPGMSWASRTTSLMWRASHSESRYSGEIFRGRCDSSREKRVKPSPASTSTSPSISFEARCTLSRDSTIWRVVRSTPLVGGWER
jgi:TolB-like protein